MAAERWTESEYRAAVDAYVTMLQADLLGEPYVKADVRRALQAGELRSRSRTSIEKRFQNISYVLASAGEPWLRGYAPLHGVGSTGRKLIADRLAELTEFNITDSEPTADEDELLARTRKHLALGSMRWRPQGQSDPERTSVNRQLYKRDAAVRAFVLSAAQGCCELCSMPAPFEMAEGIPYLEVHHVKPLAIGGSDTIMNAVALCPNCHRRAHYGIDAVEIRSELAKRIDRVVHEP